MGEIVFRHGAAEPGVPAPARVLFIPSPASIEAFLHAGSWTLREGNTCVATVRIA